MIEIRFRIPVLPDVENVLRRWSGVCRSCANEMVPDTLLSDTVVRHRSHVRNYHKARTQSINNHMPKPQREIDQLVDFRT